jgi:photosystem II stability/assembly factor-like uncharacterized protein
MHRFIMLTLVACVNLVFGQASWQIVRNPWTGHFMDVCFLPGTETGWAVGATYRDTNMTNLGSVAHTTDGGQTWEPQMGSGNAIYFVDDNYGWTVGGSGSIKHTTNGGETWIDQSSPVGDHLYSLCFIDTLEGWAFGLYGYVLHTTDAGNTWTIQYQFPDSLWIMDGIFKDSLNGWVAGYTGPAEGKIYKTTDGGDTWNLLSPGTNANFYGIDFYDLNLGWAVTSGVGIVTRTTDGGATWSPQVVYDHSLLEVKFIDALNGWVAGGDNDGNSGIFYSSDGGLTWNQQYNPTHNELWSVFTSDQQNVWAVGEYGTILHTSDAGNTWKYQAEGSGNILFGIDAPDTLNVWTTGDWGRVVLHSNDGGFTWVHQDVGDGYGYLYDVSFADELHGAVVGGSGLIYTTTNGGQTWTLRDAGNFSWYGVEFTDSLTGWVVSVSSGVIKNTSDGGNTWTYQYASSGEYFMDVMFLNDTLGWGCGFTFSNSFVVRTTDGQTWNPYTLPTSRILNSVDFVSPYLGFVVGDNGEIYRTQDGGVTWDSLHNDTLGTSDLYRVDFVDSLNGWVVSQNKIFRTRDCGNTWYTDREINLGGASNAKGLVALDTLHAFLCVGDGKILRYGTILGVEENDPPMAVKNKGILLRVIPNPVLENADIAFSVPVNDLISLQMYDAKGSLVKNLIEDRKHKGHYLVRWQGKDNQGKYLPSGVYFCHLKTSKESITKKIIFLRGVK